MFEIFHASALLGKLFQQLPEAWRGVLEEGYWYFIAICVGLLVWRLSHSSDTLPHGEVKLQWFAPTKWLGRWQEMREQGYSRAPGWFFTYMRVVQRLSNSILVLMLVFLLLCCIAFVVVLDGMAKVFPLIGGVFLVLYLRSMFKA